MISYSNKIFILTIKNLKSHNIVEKKEYSPSKIS